MCFSFVDMCKHVLAINDLNALKDFLSVLLQFYEFKSNYGPKVCKTILECFEEILKVILIILFYFYLI